MSPSIPLSVRVVVGLAVTGWEAVRHLPAELPAISVSIAGHAVRLTMRVQQEIIELAAKGDELLAVVTSRPSEHPTWAHFDEDDDALTGAVPGDDYAAEGGAGPARRAPFDEVELDVDVAWVAVGEELFRDDVESMDLDDELEVVLVQFVEEDGEVTVAATVTEDGDQVSVVLLVEEAPDHDGGAGSVDVSEGDDFAPPYLHVVPDAAAPDDAAERPAAVDEAANDDPDELAAHDGTGGLQTGGPAALPGYDRMTLAQVRGRLRGLSPDDVAALLSYEQGSAGRAPFLTLLSNRISTLEHEPQ